MKYIHPRRYWRRCKNLLNELFFSGINWKQTIIFNFRMLPCEVAKHLPILLYGKVDISQCTGKVELEKIDASYKRGQWIIGQTYCWVNGMKTQWEVTYIAIAGLLKLGETGRISNGCRVSVRPKAYLAIGDDFKLNANSKISCYDKIVIGKRVRISWGSQIYDTNFHYMTSDDKVVKRRSEKMSIGDEVWIGHDSTISKGASLASNCIVAAHSMVNKDYSSLEGDCILAGCPAKIVKRGFKRIHDSYWEETIHSYFEANPDMKECRLNYQNKTCQGQYNENIIV